MDDRRDPIPPGESFLESRFYPSKIDTWLLVVLGAASVACVVGVALMLAQGVEGGLLVALPTMGIGVGLPVWVLSATNYRLEDEMLLVRGGPLRWRIRIREIRSVRPTRNPLSSPALSLDRLRIEYGNGKALMISPRDAADLLRELQRRGGPPLSAGE